jgi:hypothetical protein
MATDSRSQTFCDDSSESVNLGTLTLSNELFDELTNRHRFRCIQNGLSDLIYDQKGDRNLKKTITGSQKRGSVYAVVSLQKFIVLR